MRRTILCASAWLLIGLATPAHSLIIAPPLSDDSYTQLRDELAGRIPAYAPGWTDHSTSDPGVPILELFAFTIEDLANRVALDIPSEVLWADFDPAKESTLGSIAYLLLDAAFLARYGNDIREPDWLAGEGIDPAWTYAELRAAAVHAVPEPAPIMLLAAGLLLVAFRRRFSVGILPATEA